MSFAYYNGTFSDFDSIRLPLSDRSIFFADGVYDACIGMGEKIYLEGEHLERFFNNASVLGLKLPFTEELFSRLLHETVKRSGIKSFFLYFQVSGNSSERKHAPRDTEKSNILITVKEHFLKSEDTLLSLVTYPDLRHSFCNVKTLNLLGSALASEYAHGAGADEAVFVKGGTVTECAHSNLFIIKNGILITHPEDEKILPGITRKRLLLTARKMGIETKERAFSLSELLSADDVIITSTSKLALRAKTLDGAEISRKKSTAGDALIADMFKCYREFC